MNDMISMIEVILIIMLCLVLIGIMVMAVERILPHFKAMQIRSTAFEELAHDLKAEHSAMKSELTDIKETLNSINKMMEEV